MTDNITIIKDISLLYELSLSVGSSLDARENCYHFLRTLIRRKGLSFASVWFHRKDNAGVGQCDLFCIYPHFRENLNTVACSPYVLKELSDKQHITICWADPHFEDVLHEKKVAEGSYAIFALGDLGFLKLFASNRPQGFDQIELDQLQPVVEKFKISLDGCLAHAQIKQETANRIIAQSALENAQVRLTNLIANLQAGILLEDEDRRIVLANQYFCDIFHIPAPPEALVGADCTLAAEQSKHLFAEPDRFVAAVDRRIRDRTIAISETISMADGRILERDFIPLFSAEKYLGHLWQYRDVTEKFKSQRAIQESEEKYRGIMENMELGLMEVDLNQTIVRPYQAFCEMIGYTAEELIGKSTLDIILPGHYHQFILDRDIERKQGQSSVYEIQLRRKDGSLMWALVSGAPIRNPAGEVVGSIGIHYDLTSRKNLEHDLAEAQHSAEQARLAERQFLANMSHEIRTPMNAVIGMTHLLYETGPTPVQKDYLDSLRFSADSLMGLIDNILDLSKIEAGELELEERTFDLRHLLKSLQQAFQFKVRDKAISMVMEFDPRINTLVKGDPTRLSQILTNLLSNASKFTERGTIGVQTNLLEKSKNYYRIEFRVHDTGIGIPKDKQTDIFGYFKQADVQTTRKFGGTGLGLTIVKQLVELQGGSIQVESEPGKGSTFIVVLTFEASAAEIPEYGSREIMAPALTHETLKQLDILSVEDNQMNQKLISRILDNWGCTYQLASNGLEAIYLAREKRFDVILMDIHMPEMDGCTATQEIRTHPLSQNTGTPIIALTAAALMEERKRAVESGMNDFLTKPFSPNMLAECILRVLEIPARPVPQFLQEPLSISEDGVKIDLQYLQELSNGDTFFVRDMIETFLIETPAELTRLHAALAEPDWEQVYRIVHKLKPNFGILGMKEQAEKALTIESNIKEGKIDATEMRTMISWLDWSAKRSFQILSEKLRQL